MNKRLYVYLLLFVIAMGSCKTKKNAITDQHKLSETKNDSDADLKERIGTLENVVRLSNRYTYYESRGNATILSGEQKNEVDVRITMEKDRYILMVITAALGIEAARILITPDSISILNRLQRTHTIAPYSYIEQLAGIKLNMQQLQEVLAGNAPFDMPPTQTVMSRDENTNSLMLVTPLNTQWKQLVYMPQKTLRPNKICIRNYQIEREVNISYDAFHSHESYAFPSDMNINIRAEKNMDCRFKLDYFAFQKSKELNFVVPKSYKTIRL